MNPEFEFTEKILIGADIIFARGGRKKWKVCDVLVRACDISACAPETSGFHIFAVPIHSPGTECTVRIIRSSSDKLVAKIVDDGFMLYLNEDKRVWVHIKMPDSPELSLGA
jgi:hypothetical protein